MLTIYVCMGEHCEKRGAKLLAYHLSGLIHQSGLAEQACVRNDYCRSCCQEGPVVQVGSQTFTRVAIADADTIMKEVFRQLAFGQDVP